MITALIDGDLSSFIPAASAEKDTVEIAIWRTNQFVDNILAATGADNYEIYLSGKSNFRYQLYPEYKANRVGGYRPTHEQDCREFLLSEWGAKLIDGCEADDWLGVRQCSGEIERPIICSIDKDMDMIPGWHYSWAILREGKEVRPAKEYFVSDEEALYNFYYQMLVGDAADNIKGARGIGPKKAVGILQGCKTEEEYINTITPYFSCEEEMIMTAQVLWIWREPGGIWARS